MPSESLLTTRAVVDMVAVGKGAWLLETLRVDYDKMSNCRWWSLLVCAGQEERTEAIEPKRGFYGALLVRCVGEVSALLRSKPVIVDIVHLVIHNGVSFACECIDC